MIPVTTCRVCGTVANETFRLHGFDWTRCQTCGGVQKVLTLEQYWALSPTYDPGQYLDSSDRAEIETYLGTKAKAELLSRFVKRKRGPGDGKMRFLDVGCGMGGYLVAAQSLGFEVLGFEPSKNHAHVARDLLRLPVIDQYFTRSRLDKQKFDVIMLSHVIEHILHPDTLLNELIHSLNPEGVLIVVTPNSDSLIARLTGRHWVMLRPVDHVTMICAKAFDHFSYPLPVQVHHSSSEFSYEFAATIGATLRALLVRRPTSCTPAAPISTPSILRQSTLRAYLVRFVLTTISLPFHLAARLLDRQACLTIVIRRVG